MNDHIRYSNDRPCKISVSWSCLAANRRTMVIHILGWSGYICLEMLVLGIAWHHQEPLYVYACYYALNIGFFYGIIWSLSRSGAKRAWPATLGRVALVFLSYLLIKFLANCLIYSPAFDLHVQFAHIGNFLLTAFYRSYLFFIPAVFVSTAAHLSDSRRQALQHENARLNALKDQAELEVRLSAAENAYLQQQLNPHLLFNTLNFIYGEVLAHSETGARAVELLADILRYTMEVPPADGRVLLAEELQQVRNLIEIQGFRLPGASHLQVRLDDAATEHRVLPLILLTLTENIFKHGDLSDPGRPALLQVTVDDAGHLRYHSRNLKKNVAASPARQGIGLRNIRLRLDHVCPGRYGLVISDTNADYELTLDLDL